jgi:Ca2+-binding RTX toxin-like protein
MSLEQLESRRLMTATANFAAGVVTVTSDADSDEIFVYVDDEAMGGPRLVIEDYDFEEYDGPLYTESYDFSLNSVDELQVFGHGGWDSIYIWLDGVDLPAYLSGGSGTDEIIIEGGDGPFTLNGGSGDDTLAGGNGNDLIYGGDGADLIRGHGGNDTVYGGAGNDQLIGGAGSDLLYGGADNDLLDARDGTTIDHVFGDGGFDTAKIDIWIYGNGAIASDWSTGVEAYDWS